MTYIRLSDISEAGYCLRRASIILNEVVWNDNQYTIQGTHDHEHAHQKREEKTKDEIIFHEFYVTSEQYGIHGICDSVKLKKTDLGVTFPNYSGYYKIIPIEYKHGCIRDELSYSLQLCGQCLCLEEMYATHIQYGYIYYTSSNRKKKINFDEELREKTIEIIDAIRKVKESGKIISPVYSSKCRECAQRDYCMPEIKDIDTKRYCSKIWEN